MEKKKERLEISIKGDVQGVNFRYYTKEVAKRLGVTGWIRNEVDGSISLVVEGDPKNLDEFLGWCHEGPPLATVKEVEVRKGEYTGEFDNFEIR